MAIPTIPNGEEYFFPIIYEGNGAGQRVGKFVPFTDNGTIDNSLIFNDGDSPKLAITPSSNGDRKTWTFSAWIKRGVLGQKAFFSWDNTAPGGGGGGDFRFDSSNRLQLVAGGGTTMSLVSNRTFEDTSKYYHIYIKVDTTQSTTADRVEIYVDGDKITSFSTGTYPSLNKDFNINNTSYETRFGALNDNGSLTNYFDGYLAEVNFVDGTNPAVSTFGVTDTSTGRWIPKTLSGITYGTNGFRLKFQDSSALGDDTSGNTNDFTATNLASTDQTTDSPTQNHATLSPHSLYKSSNFTLSEGNLKATSTSTAGTHSGQGGMRIPNGGKYYWECEIDSGKNGMGIGIIPADTPTTSANPSTATLYLSSGSMRTDGSNAISYGSGVSDGDIMGFALDLSNPANGKLYVSVNGTYENSGNPVTGANPAPANPLIGDFRVIYQDGSNGFAPVYIYNFGQKSFNTAPPTGFSALQQDNLPETDKGISGFTWIKDRDNALNHNTYDSSNGVFNRLVTNNTSAILNTQGGVSKFLKGGIVVGDTSNVNNSGASMVAWNWVANSGTTSTNTDGSVTSTVQANTTAGFSIVQWTGGGSAATVGHGLSQTPEWIFYKRTSAAGDGWIVYHTGQNASPANGSVQLQSNGGFTSDSTLWNNTAPTSSVISIGSYGMGSSEERTAWVWHSVDGFSKFGKYTGNGSTDGPFVYTGFRPAFVLMKRVNTTGNWYLKDTTRDTFNPCEKTLMPNLTNAEAAQTYIDILSNGFKQRIGNDASNISGSTYIYIAFAEHPFVGDGTSPVTAR